MAEKIKFGYFQRINYSDIEFKEFNKDFLEDKSSKFVQLYINGEPVIVAGNDFYHRDILKLCLKKFNIKFNIRLDASKNEVPLEKGDNYELVGAGKVKLFGDKLNFYDASTDYMVYVRGTNRKNLEDMFGKDSILVEEKGSFGPFFLVEFKGN